MTQPWNQDSKSIFNLERTLKYQVSLPQTVHGTGILIPFFSQQMMSSLRSRCFTFRRALGKSFTRNLPIYYWQVVLSTKLSFTMNPARKALITVREQMWWDKLSFSNPNHLINSDYHSRLYLNLQPFCSMFASYPVEHYPHPWLAFFCTITIEMNFRATELAR